MKLAVTVNDRQITIDTDRLDAVREIEPGVYSVLLNGASIVVRISPESAGYLAASHGYSFHSEVADPRNMAYRSKAAFGAGQQEIRAQMPGKVIRVLVEEGGQVDAGQGLVVVEAMKMQNEMKAPRTGRVKHVRVRAGDTVAAGDVLIAIE